MRPQPPVVFIAAPSGADRVARAARWRELLGERGASEIVEVDEAAIAAASARALGQGRAVLVLRVADERTWDRDAAEALLGELPAAGLRELLDGPAPGAELAWDRGLPPWGPSGEPLPPGSPGGRPELRDPTDDLPGPSGTPPLPDPDFDLPGWSLPGGQEPEPPPPLDVVAPPVQIEGGTNDVHVLWPSGGGALVQVQAGAQAASQLFALTADTLALSASTVIGFVRITAGAAGAQEVWRWSPGKAWAAPFRVVPLSAARYEAMNAIVSAARGATTTAAWEACWPDEVAFVWRGIATSPVVARSKPARRWMLGARRADSVKAAASTTALYLSLPADAQPGALVAPVWYVVGAAEPVALATGHHLRVTVSARPGTGVALYPELS